MSHQIDRQLHQLWTGPDIGECLNPAVYFQHRHWKAGEIVLVEEPEREAFLCGVFMSKPVVRDGPQLRKNGLHVRRRDESEPRAIALEAVVREPHLLARA